MHPTRGTADPHQRPHQRLEAVRLHLEEGKSIGAIAALFVCGRTVVHRAIKARTT